MNGGSTLVASVCAASATQPVGRPSRLMIDATTASRIASEHVNAKPAPLEGYRLAFGEMQEVADGWFFRLPDRV